MLRCRGVHKGDVAVEVDIRIQSALDKQLHRLGQHGVLQINGRDRRGRADLHREAFDLDRRVADQRTII